jgi:hypothetical protein
MDELISENRVTSFEKSAINLQGHFWKLIIVPATIVVALGSF